MFCFKSGNEMRRWVLGHSVVFLAPLEAAAAAILDYTPREQESLNETVQYSTWLHFKALSTW